MFGQVALAAVNAAVYENNPVLAEMAVQTHLSCGALVFGLTAVRLVWRLCVATPALPQAMGSPARFAAHAVHGALYALLLLLPLSGYVKLAALGYEVMLFGTLPLPALPFDPDVAALARRLHTLGASLLGLLVVGHVAAALFHARLFGQSVLGRMFSQPARRAHGSAG